jgi:cytochrome c
VFCARVDFVEIVSMYMTKSRVIILGLGIYVGVLSPASAQSTIDQAAGLSLAQSQACMACHQVDSKRVGPPLRSIGERYATAGDNSATVRYLADKIRSGGGGVWGAVPMPAQRHVSDENALKLAEWMLSLGASKAK